MTDATPTSSSPTSVDRGTDSPTVRVLGKAAAEMLYDANWVNRRKESVHLLNDAWVRRQTSTDFTLPPSLEPIGENPDGKGLFCVPVTLLPKLPPTLMRFDFKDEDGRTIPLPTRFRNGLAAYAGLCHSARVIAEGDASDDGEAAEKVIELPSRLREALLSVAFAEPDDAVGVAALLQAGTPPPLGSPLHRGVPLLGDAEAALKTWGDELRWRASPRAEGQRQSEELGLESLAKSLSEDDRFVWLVGLMATDSVVMAHFPAPATGEKVLRLSYEQSVFQETEARTAKTTVRLGWRPVTFLFKTPYAAAKSFHFEFEPPEGLEVIGSLLLDSDDFEAVQQRDASQYEKTADTFAALEADQAEYAGVEPRRGTRVHLYEHDATEVDTAGVALRVRVQRDGFVTNAFLTSLALSVLITFFAGAAGPLVRNGTSAPSFLLLFPSLVAAAVSRAGGHALIARMLRLARGLLLGNVVFGVMAAAAIIVTHTGQGADAPKRLYLYWGVLAGLSWLVTAVLYTAYRLPRPSEEQGWLERSVATFVGVLRRIRRWNERLRTRRFGLCVESNGLTWAKARSIVSVCDGDEHLRVRTRPRWGLRVRGVRALVIKTLFKRPKRRILSYGSRPPDGAAAFDTDARDRLIATLSQISRHLGADYYLVLRWGNPLGETQSLAENELRERLERSDLQHRTRYCVRVPAGPVRGERLGSRGGRS